MRPIFILSFVAGAYAVGDQFPFNPTTLTTKFTYLDQTTDAWTKADVSGVCDTGTNQSPIDIVTASATIPTDDPGMPMINNLNPEQTYKLDIGAATDGTGLTIYQATFGITAADFGVPSLTGGPFDAGDSYNFAFGEFKWHMTSDTMGSEHSIDGTFAPLELQMVFLKSSAGFIKDAATYTANVKTAATAKTLDPSAVAVISYQFEIADTANAELATIISAAVTAAVGTAEEVKSYNLSALLNPDNTDMLEDYYYYDGSLTLPTSNKDDVKEVGCNEIVRWLLPTTKLSLSQAQLEEIRGSNLAKAIQGTQGDSFARGIRTNTITVYHRKKPTSTDIWQSLATSLLSVGTFGLVHTFLTQPDTAKALTENPIVDVLADFEQRFVNPIATADQRSAPNHHRHNPQF